MSDEHDDILLAIAEEARAERDDPTWDPRFEALAEGTLSSEEQAALLASIGDDPRGRAAFDAVKPPEPHVNAGLVDAILAQRAAEHGAQGGELPRSQATVSDREARGAKNIPFRARRWARVAVPVFAAAAAMTLVLWPSAPPPLPPYRLELSATALQQRGDAPAVEGEIVVHLGAGDHVVVVLRPAARVEGPVAARAFWRGAGPAEVWSAPLEVADGGAVRLDGSGDALFGGRPGRWEIAIAVGRPEAMPTDAAQVFQMLDEGGVDPEAPYRLLTARARVVEQPAP